MTTPERCNYCEKPAVVYCDYVAPSKHRLLNRAMKICDRPICADHRRLVGHMCDRSRRTTNNRSDTIDHCRAHYEGSP